MRHDYLAAELYAQMAIEHRRKGIERIPQRLAYFAFKAAVLHSVQTLMSCLQLMAFAASDPPPFAVVLTTKQPLL